MFRNMLLRLVSLTHPKRTAGMERSSESERASGIRSFPTTVEPESTFLK
jgi:hypothetical protein